MKLFAAAHVLLCLCAVSWSAPLLAESDSDIPSLEQEIWDPIEPVNRGIFWFNDRFDTYLLEPVARGYDSVMPDRVQTGVGNFFDNLRFPSNFVSDLVQLEFGAALEETGRFLLNTTVGIGGLMDVAKEVGLEKQDEDFGIALASHGVAPGPYLVIPLVGPSNLRDGFGRVVDMFLSPIFYVGTIFDLNDGDALAISLGAKALDVIDQRADMFEAVETAKQSSLDYYLFVQTAYYQYRRGMLGIKDPEKSTTAEDPLADPLAQE